MPYDSHVRWTVVFVVVASVILPLAAQNRPASPSTQEGLRLLHRMQDALGGADKIASVRDLEETIRAEAWDSNGTALGQFRKRTRWLRNPSVLRLDQRGLRGTYVLYFNENSGTGWELLPDVTGADPFKTTGKPIDLVGGELEFARNYLTGFELNRWLADRLPGHAITSPKPNVLRITNQGGASELTLNAATGLPDKSRGVSLSDPDRPVPSELRFEDWKDVGEVHFPMRRANYLSGLKRGEAITETLRVNVGLRVQDLATVPVDFAPEIPRP